MQQGDVGDYRQGYARDDECDLCHPVHAKGSIQGSQPRPVIRPGIIHSLFQDLACAPIVTPGDELTGPRERLARLILCFCRLPSILFCVHFVMENTT